MFLLSSGLRTQDSGACISASDAELLTLVNEYRQQNGLEAVPWSRSSMTVGQCHVWDAINNDAIGGECNLHSWSSARPELWYGMCYTSDHASASLMWSKPSEVTGGILSGYRFENAARGYISVAGSLNGWKNRTGHNDVILNQGIWTDWTWNAMGVGTDLTHRYYFLWFSDLVDPQPEMPLCSGSLLFRDEFEE